MTNSGTAIKAEPNTEPDTMTIHQPAAGDNPIHSNTVTNYTYTSILDYASFPNALDLRPAIGNLWWLAL